MDEYAIYKGEELLMIGTIEEIAKARGVKPASIRFYTFPAYQKRIAKRKKMKNEISLVNFDVE